ncbi:receptor-type tyrosine-protein phosphatase eta-like [Anarhichas minor]|uniref:receptor-type tyrosine-protein phosphatase eta-like n=1 Tax=Anarhichas minor TaxID=65739 RepID=UPI003F738C50
MKPVLLSSVPLWTLLVFSAVLKISRAECNISEGGSNEIINTTTTTVESRPNCNISIGNNVSGIGSITGLIPGASYEVFLKCLNCCTVATTKPEVVRNLTVTDVTTSSISVTWTKPEGTSSFYRVQWTDGKRNETTETSTMITGLTPGVKFTIVVTAVAADNLTEGEKANVSLYTKPGEIGEPTVSTSTSSISLNWTSPLGEVFKYRLEWHNGGALMTVTTNKTFAVLSDLIPGTSYTISVIAVAGDNKTEGHPHTFSTFTKPEVVRNITVANITTSSISLMWTKPEGTSSFYRVQWTDGKRNETTETSTMITGLTPGVKFTIVVTAVAADNLTEGEKANVSLYTRPGEIGEPTVSTSTSSISLNWTSPLGEVFKYRLEWHNGGALMTVTTNKTFAVLSDLIPGTSYTISVIAVAGDNKTEGHPHTLTSVTKPAVVRNLSVIDATTSSVSLNWTEPDGNASSYTVQWTARGDTINTTTTTETYFTINQLIPGVQYEIIVAAVAVNQSNEGKGTSIRSFTMPNPVLNLTASPKSTTSIKVIWSAPLDAKLYYKYLVQTYNTTGELFNTTVNNNSTDVTELEPGTRYDINVTTMAAEGSVSTVEQTFGYTMPKAVTDLTMEDVNTTLIRLSWRRQSDHKPSYSYLVKALQDAMVVQNESTETETYTFYNLTPGKLYTFDVFTVVEGVKSTVESTRSHTKPEAVSGIMAIGSTTTMSVSWTPAVGQVDSYTVQLSRDSGLVENGTDLSNATMNKEFMDLTPGVFYCVAVVTKSGPLKSRNSSVCNATFPNPPGPIMVESQTVKSINFTWSSPEGMDHDQYNFSVSSFNGSFLIRNNWFLLNNLQSGSSSNISVVTVGVLNYKSTAVTAENYTRPYPVTMLRQTEITTNAVTLEWKQPENKSHYSYLLETTNGSFNKSEVVLNKHDATITGLLSGSNYSFTVTTQTADGTQAAPVTVSYFTRPYSIRGLKPETLNTTAVRLVWTKPLEYKSEYTYRVKTTGCGSQNTTLAGEVAEISALTPGTNCTFCVFVRAADGIEGEASCTSQYTEPEAVQPSISSWGSNSSILVSWAEPLGKVEQYKVYLNSTSTASEVVMLDSTNTSFLFDNLSAGRVYTAVVTTFSGPFNASSDFITNATFPNPPGPIMVESQTVKSINFTWSSPEGMDHDQYNFSVSSFNGSFLIRNNWFLLNNLQSGSSSNISVVTVGVLNYKSTAVTAENYTRPYPVTMLRQTEITTNAVTLEWKQPENKSHYSYLLETTNGSFNKSEVVLNKHNATITGLLSGSNYSFTVTTQTADGTQAAPVTVSYFTRPYSIRGLKPETLNTTAVRLVWTKPLEYKSEYTYRVKTTGCGSQNTTLAGKVAEISALTPGTNCTFCVFVRAADGIEGEASCTSQYTEPEAVQPSISSWGSNSSILVSWAEPLGKVEQYKVYLNSTSTASEVVMLDSTNTSFLFDNLSAGRVYTAVVTTFSGPFNASSDFITNATFPNPPGPIDVLTQTTSYIDIRWKEAPLMTGATFHYQLTKSSPQGEEHDTTTNTSHNFTSLLSGTSYNFSVATVGAMGFKSEKAQINLVTTRPLSVKSLTASTEEESITVVWAVPDEYKDSYRYNVTWQSSDGLISVRIEENTYNIVKLVPGKQYNISVTTETSDGTKGAARWISDCTNASPVKDLECKGPNTTNAQVILSWNKPIGQHSGFKVTVNDSEIINSTSTCCRHTVSNLRHKTKYNLAVETQSCGPPSTPVSLDCWTGITNPPIPVNYESLVLVSSKTYNKFTLQIESSLLNSTNGPITHIGVLVTNALPGDTSDFTKYVGKTYKQWQQNDTPVYMATVVENIFQSRSGVSDRDIEIGDESKWNGYTNGALTANGIYRYAIVLYTSLTLQNGLVNGEVSLLSITNFHAPVTLPQDPAVIGIAVGVTLGIFCLLFIILIGFIIYWKRVSNKESPDIQIHSMRAKVSVAVRVEEYEAYYKKQKADSNCGFAEEFEDLKPVGTAQSKTNAERPENKSKNRYNNVHPYDSSRVKLSIIHGSPYDDYINANYMPGFNSRKEYIAAQGPLPTTVNEFWRMIWEKNVQTLVMLTRCNEQGRVKCEQYWDHGTKHFENITVTTTSEIELEDWTIRDFDIKNVKTAETRSVRHFHFTAWPDHGVPQTTELLISFRHLVREHMDQYSRHSPTVVHCSAGVGRTGTLIAIDRLIFQIERENIVDVYGIIHDLRMHRPLMVQTEDQYVFLNQCAVDIIRSRTGTNVDLIYQNSAALSIYENIDPKTGSPKGGPYYNA